MAEAEAATAVGAFAARPARLRYRNRRAKRRPDAERGGFAGLGRHPPTRFDKRPNPVFGYFLGMYLRVARKLYAK